ncbi:hypothetical protein FE257_002083 [Aspergillus nanangensis]|uniref:Clr5 domain-containing protein n=1 Tax=Aspergillus nanangensis TaxID=2582783 RepID=A0AAD4CTA2_ASPNN|nr:hypothetical protein FE257_002083 [Aspergillus nanangensis]
MSKNAPRIPGQLWEQHKEAIVTFYVANPLNRTIEHMIERYAFRASENQYTRKLKAWGIEKYHPTRDWELIYSKKRKRSEEGKESEITIRARKYSRLEVEKEIARHVRLGRDGWISDGILPDYITVCTPKAEGEGSVTVDRDFLLRDLPWYQCIQKLEVLVSGGLSSGIVPSTGNMSIELAMRKLAPRPDSDLPQLRIPDGFSYKSGRVINAYLPPERMPNTDPLFQGPKNIWDQPAFAQLKAFLQRFIFLSVNKVLDQWKFNKICDWIVEKGGEHILVFLCRLRSPLMKVFAEKVFRSTVMSGNVYLGRKVFQVVESLQAGDAFRSQRLASYLSDAVKKGHEAMVDFLCKEGAHPEVSDSWIWQGDQELKLPVLRTLLEFGANPEKMITNREVGFPLVNAALRGSLEAVKLLVEHGSQIDNYLPMYYGTALQAAAYRGHLDVARYLIQRGANVNVPFGLVVELSRSAVDDDAQLIPLLTPVQIASKTNNLDLLHVLLEQRTCAINCPAFPYPDSPEYIWALIQPYRTTQQRYKPLYHESPYGRYGLVYSPLQYSVINQNPEMVAALLSTGVAPDFRIAPDVQDTPLQMSARLGNVEIFQLLFIWGASIDAPPAGYNGRTALQGAAESGNWKIVASLLGAGVQINEPAGKDHGLTALQAACLNGHSLIAGVLLFHGADPNLDPSPNEGLTTTQAAAVHGDIGTVKDLITLGANFNNRATRGGITALLAVIRHKSLPLVELLVMHGADVNPSGDFAFPSPLGDAAASDWFEGVRFLLDHGANVNHVALSLLESHPDELPLAVDLYSPLGWAIANGNDEMIYLLVKNGANVLLPAFVCDIEPGEPGGSLILALSHEPSLEIIDFFLEQAPQLEMHPGWENALRTVLIDEIDVNFSVRQRIIVEVNSLTPLLRLRAIQKAWDALPSRYDDMDSEEQGMIKIIETLIEIGAPLETRDENGSTLLMRTARGGYVKSCSFIISRGATVNTHAGQFRGTPLQEAIKAGHVDIANCLLDHGADVNALPADDCGVTALQAASINGIFELAVQLLERGADISAPAAPEHGRTAIDGSAERGHFDMVKLLLNAYGEDVDLGPVCRQAAGYAEKEEHFELAQWLREFPSS